MNDSQHGWLFGYLLLVGLFTLAAGIAFKHVEENTSFGLTAVLEVIKAMLIFWAGWKFGNSGRTQ
jgi:hypothetical protein